jgi:UDP-N-acetylglucosamine 2-epimerase (non-hydrolysing)
LRDENPDLVLVQGDTTTAFVGALVAYYHKIPCGHIEAGLRTGDKFAPFPEEINRKLIGAVADLHFAPTLRAKQNLLREGVPERSVFVTGNTVVDALLWTLQRLPEPNRTNEGQRMILVTAHRRENWGEPMERICKALRRIADKFPDVQIVFPMHKNPVVREVAYRVMGDHDRIKLCEPPDYFEFVRLMRDAYLIVTDSGGVQEEAPTLGKPVLVLREKTERPEAVEAGVVKVIGTDEERIVAEVSRLLSDEGAYRAMQRPVNPYGDGKAAMRIKAGNPPLLRKSGTPRRVFVAVSETKRAGRKNPALNPSLDGNFLALLSGAVESGQHLHNGDTIVSIRQRFPAFLDAGYELPHLLKVGVAFVHS